MDGASKKLDGASEDVKKHGWSIEGVPKKLDRASEEDQRRIKEE